MTLVTEILTYPDDVMTKLQRLCLLSPVNADSTVVLNVMRNRRMSFASGRRRGGGIDFSH